MSGFFGQSPTQDWRRRCRSPKYATNPRGRLGKPHENALRACFPDADLAACEAQLADICGVTTQLEVQLPAPLVQLIRDLVDGDTDAQHAACEALKGPRDVD